MLKQIFKENVPIEYLFEWLDKFCVKNEKFYTPIIGETIYSVNYSDVNNIEILVNSGETY